MREPRPATDRGSLEDYFALGGFGAFGGLGADAPPAPRGTDRRVPRPFDVPLLPIPTSYAVVTLTVHLHSELMSRKYVPPWW
jgi:hypothetical protein